MSANDLSEALGPVCRDRQRRADILQSAASNGIDFVEYERRAGSASEPDRHWLVVHFINPLPSHGYKLPAHPELVHLIGGNRIVGLRVLQVVCGSGRLEIEVDRAGDFSTYWLLLGWRLQPDGNWELATQDLDRQFSRAPVNFKAGCPVGFDCREETLCPEEAVPEPVIDYLARDYASFRRLLLDAIPRLNPDWLERNPADLGMTLVELLAYEGDQLSYFQDAVANEAYLDTARQRVSAKRHARLLDYRMHDGRNAWTFVHLEAQSAGVLPAGTRLLTRIGAPLMGQTAPPGTEVSRAELPDDRFELDPALAQVRVFETAGPAAVQPVNNRILIHAWGNLDCCLPRGTTQADLYAVDPEAPSQATRPEVKAGDDLLFEEVLGVRTGLAADADAAHRQVVRLVQVETLSDPLYSSELSDGALQISAGGGDALPLLRVVWRREDALDFPLCLASRPDGDEPIRQVSVARGNLALADHGRTIRETLTLRGSPARAVLEHGPLTLQCPPETAAYALDTDGWPVATAPRTDLAAMARSATPAVAVAIDDGSGPAFWEPVPDLLDSTPESRNFVTDVDHSGRATLRFGDGDYGRYPRTHAEARTVYRVGNGRAGNIGAEALAHVMAPDYTPEPLKGQWPVIAAVRNPLPARDGTDPETIEQVRQYAPAACHAEQFRAVTVADYVRAAEQMPEVAGAMADFRWTGSWLTVCIAVDPRDPADLITEPGGSTRLAPAFEQRALAFLTRYRLAGYDLAVRSAEYVPLEIDLSLCVKPGHFRGDVVHAVTLALSNRTLPSGRTGFFHSDNLSFGQPVYLSRLVAAVMAVEGVESVIATRFRRFGSPEDAPPEDGAISLGAWEIARLDNDPNFMENGLLRIDAGGGK